MLQDFKNFLMRGNVIDLAVAVIIGIAFGAVVTAFTDGVLMAAIAGVVGQPSFDSISFGIGDSDVLIGTFLTALVNFVIIAGALFVVVKTFERMQARGTEIDVTEEPEAPEADVELLTEIRDLLKTQSQQPRPLS